MSSGEEKEGKTTEEIIKEVTELIEAMRLFEVDPRVEALMATLREEEERINAKVAKIMERIMMEPILLELPEKWKTYINGLREEIE